jgi:electron transfer flavoprotein-quinone oxidoreductase
MNADVVIVGAGPAGLSAAITLARAGVRPMVLERGLYPGAKNMFGGVLYGRALHDLLPAFWERAPIERRLVRRTFTLLTNDAAVSLDLRSPRLGTTPDAGWIIARSRFDRWLGAEAEEAGALVVPETTVDDLLWEGGRVAGVRVRRAEGEVHAPVVVAADGVMSLLAQRAGLRGPPSCDAAALGVKEVLQLPREVVESRFQLRDDEGVEHIFVGEATGGQPGGGFLYTLRDGIALGVIVQLDSLKAGGTRPQDLLEQFKAHSAVAPLVAGGTAREYSAHLIPEGGYTELPRLVTDGFLVIGDAAGLVAVNGIHFEGMNLAIASGVAAAETILEARRRGDFSAAGLEGYARRLRNGFVLQDLQHFRNAGAFLRSPRLYREYPQAACDFLERLYRPSPPAKASLWQSLAGSLAGRVSWPQVVRDAWGMWRSL